MPADVPAEHGQGLLDTNIVILRRWLDPGHLPREVAISAITLAELTSGLHAVRGDAGYDPHEERARRLDILQRVEHEFDPIPFGGEAARAYGRVSAAVISAGRKPRGRVADLMIAAVALCEDLPLYTTNPADFSGLEKLLPVVPVPRPTPPHES